MSLSFQIKVFTVLIFLTNFAHGEEINPTGSESTSNPVVEQAEQPANPDGVPTTQLPPQEPAQTVPVPETVDVSASEPAVETSNMQSRELREFSFVLGGDVGASALISSANTESDKVGYHLGLKALVSYRIPRVMIDLGLGWFFNRSVGQRTNAISVRISTQSALLEFSPMFRLSENFSIGPGINYLFGSDVSFAEDASDSNPQDALFAGIRILSETSLNWSRFRFGGSFLTDVSISERQVFIMLLHFQIAIPFYRY